MTAQTTTKPRPLIIGLPGSFDSADYASYRSWLKHLPELGADVRMLDMLQLPGIKQLGRAERGPVYYCDWQPEDYLDLIELTIRELNPSQTILLGFGFGAHEAMRSAFALSLLGQPVAGVVGILPSPLDYASSVYREVGDLPKQPVAELRKGMLAERFAEYGIADTSRLLSCARYEDLRRPHNGAVGTFHMPEHVLQRYRNPFDQKFIDKVKAYRQGHLGTTGELLRSRHYTTPTALIAAAESWYLPPEKVSALARRSKRAETGFVELPGVCYDFRAYPSQVDHVTEAVMDKVGQLLTTGTVHRPRPARTLLLNPKSVTDRPMGTIVLSSARPPYYHRSAIQLAKESGANLAVLASHDLDVGIVAADMARSGVRGYIIDMPTDYKLPLTADFAVNKHAAVADRKGNLSTKRNIGLLYGYLADQKLFFLDDDIHGLSAQGLYRAAAQLDHYTVAGFQANLHPDNSVVCHANRLAGNDQAVFMSGSALGVNAAAAQSFFPNVYNEDWLFCHDAVKARGAVLLGDVRQLPYNPFSPSRAAAEEFGDILAEGLHYLLTTGVSLAAADEDFWRYYLWRRRRFIASIARRLAAPPHGESTQVPQALQALGASKRKLATYTPQDFVTYVQAWRSDIKCWQELLDKLPRHMSTEDAMRFVAGETGLTLRIVESNI